MKVLLTGAFGNVGVSTMDELLRQGHEVRCFDLRTPGNERTAKRYGGRNGGRIEVVWGDLRIPADVAAAVAGVDVVLHVAFIIPKMSRTGVESEQRPDWAEAVNVGGTRHLIQAIQAQAAPPRLVFTSSVHVYGRTHHLAPPRTADEPVHPVEHYARHKVQCEEMIRASGLRWAILRLAATLPIALKLDPGMFDVPPENRMEYVHTRDVGLALTNAVSSDEIWGKTLLIGGGPRCHYLYGDIVARIMAALGLDVLPRAAFATVPFATDWMDTAESQRLLRYQTRTLDDYIADMTRLMGPRVLFTRLLKSAVQRSLLAQSPHWRRHAARQHAASNWEGKTALVTGASSGIGAAVARKLAHRGARVLLVARRAERLELLADEIRRDGGVAHVIAANLADESARAAVLAQARTLAGNVDFLVNSAGLGWYGYGADMPWSIAWEMMQTNMTALAHLTLLVLRDMQARGSGHIINISSISGSLPEQGTALYSATKSFVDNFTTALTRELHDTRVRISLVRPGPVQTEFFDRAADRTDGRRIPGERFAISPERVAARVVGVLRRPRRVAYVPDWLRVVPWVEPLFGWIIDRLGPALLRRRSIAN